jgi:hypothetical protein
MTKRSLSDDGYLLQKVVPAKKIQRTIDWKPLGITKEYINEQCELAHGPFDEKFHFTDNRKIPNLDSEEEMDRYYITDLCMPYNPIPDDRDEFVYYNDIGALCGDAGYLRIRDGYVWGRRIVWRS